MTEQEQTAYVAAASADFARVLAEAIAAGRWGRFGSVVHLAAGRPTHAELVQVATVKPPPPQTPGPADTIDP